MRGACEWGLTSPPQANVATIPGDVDIVDVFRRSEQVSEHADDILAKKPGVVWLQDGRTPI